MQVPSTPVVFWVLSLTVFYLLSTLIFFFEIDGFSTCVYIFLKITQIIIDNLPTIEGGSTIMIIIMMIMMMKIKKISWWKYIKLLARTTSKTTPTAAEVAARQTKKWQNWKCARPTNMGANKSNLITEIQGNVNWCGIRKENKRSLYASEITTVRKRIQ